MPVNLKLNPREGIFYLEFIRPGERVHYRQSGVPDESQIRFVIFAKYAEGWEPIPALEYKDRREAEKVFKEKRKHFKVKLAATVEGATPCFIPAR